MRSVALFVAGTLAGIAATSLAQSQGPNRGVVGINHVALAVPDIDKAVEHYTKVMGFPEAFRVRTLQVYTDNNGQWQMAAHQSTRLGR